MGGICACFGSHGPPSETRLPPRRSSKWASAQNDERTSRESSWMSCDATPATTVSRPCSRTGEFYGYRNRIPSRVNMAEHPEEYWWSEADLANPTIARDMGVDPIVISRVIKVTVVPSVFFASHRDIEVFPEYLDACRNRSEKTRAVIFKIKMGNQIMVSLSEAVDEANFDEIFSQENRDRLLSEKFKFILSPINSPLPIPVKKPRDAQTVGAYFGMDNVDYYVDEENDRVKIVSIFINIYSKWIIRKFLPLSTSTLGRICDFILLSSDERIVYTDFRLLSTKVSRALIKNAAI